MRVIDRLEVKSRLTQDVCIPIIREAMIRLSNKTTCQLLRSMLPLGDGKLLGVMPGGLGTREMFGAKLVSLFPADVAGSTASHQGLVALFDGLTGAPVCIVEAGELTAIRTAAASAVATDALARRDASRVAIFGTGIQAYQHAHAMSCVRKLSEIVLWGRSARKAELLAEKLRAELDVTISFVVSAEQAAAQADIICTVTHSPDPILFGRWVQRGAHINLVGSSWDGPVEVDHELVLRARFIADSRDSVLAQGSEFLHAKRAGLIGDDHVVGEIGEVLSGRLEGRRDSRDITLYKSLGHVVQDLAAAHALYRGSDGAVR